MEFADIQNVNILSAEKIAIQRALMLFDAGGRIVEMAISPPEAPQGTEITPVPMGASVRVPTRYIQYPAQMVDAIKLALDGRLVEIEAELGKLGVTGMPTGRITPASGMQSGPSGLGRRTPSGR